MSLVALGGMPLVNVGCPDHESYSIGTLNTVATLAAANAAAIFIGQVFTEDGASHTIDTTGSSSLGWRAGAVTFANAGTTVKVGLAAVDTANGPPGRAVNAAGVITFDVSKSLVGGGGGITATSWLEHVPDAGTKTIAHGDLVAFCVQMTARGGADSVIATGPSIQSGNSLVLPSAASFNGTATYTAIASYLDAVITFSDGKVGFFYGAQVQSAVTTQTWNSTSSPSEYGNLIQMPVPARIHGIVAAYRPLGDASVVLYSDPLGTPVAEKTVSVDLNVVGTTSSGRFLTALFPTPYDAIANQPLAAILKPTTATDISANYKSFNAAAHQKSETLGANCYAVNRASGAFAAQNSSKDRFAIGLLVGGFDAGAAGGGLLINPGMRGGLL